MYDQPVLVPRTPPTSEGHLRTHGNKSACATAGPCPAGPRQLFGWHRPHRGMHKQNIHTLKHDSTASNLLETSRCPCFVQSPAPVVGRQRLGWSRHRNAAWAHSPQRHSCCAAFGKPLRANLDRNMDVFSLAGVTCSPKVLLERIRIRSQRIFPAQKSLNGPRWTVYDPRAPSSGCASSLASRRTSPTKERSALLFRCPARCCRSLASSEYIEVSRSDSPREIQHLLEPFKGPLS